MNQLQGEVERKKYLVARSEKEMDVLHRENIQLSHENDKLSEKLKREEEETARINELLDKVEKDKKEIGILQKENIKLNHKNEEFSEKIKRGEENIKRINELLDKVEENKDQEIAFLQNKIKHIYVVIDGEKSSLLTRKAVHNILEKIDFGLKFKPNNTSCKKCFNGVSEKEKYCDFCGEKTK